LPARQILGAVLIDMLLLIAIVSSDDRLSISLRTKVTAF
jgi:hypothetical protein